jgi:hypothetical protein
MLLYLAIFIAGGVAFVALWRLIARLLLGAVLIVVFAALGRAVLLLEPRMGDGDLLAPMVAGGFGMAVVGMLFYRQIHNWLVDADLRRTIERDKAQAAARRI